jgi:serpin B
MLFVETVSIHCRNLEFFIQDDQESILHQAMTLEGYFRGADLPTLNAKVLELPYEDQSFRMLVFLPRGNSSIAELDRNIKKLNIDQLDKELVGSEYFVQMPKFKIEASQDMREVLENTGFSSLFDSPDLSDIAQSTSPNGSFQKTEVLHRVVLEVSEQGTEAAAATAIGIDVRQSDPTKAVNDFIVNRPFVFIIQDKELGVPLFMGRIIDPRGKK